MKYGRELQGWHSGERQVRANLGYDKIPATSHGFLSIKPEMPPEHAQFYMQNVSFLPVTTLDAQGRPWGSILASEGGLPGFLSRTSYSTLSVNAKSWPGNPISKHPISTDALIAGIGIEFGTRRRNKLAGVISQSTEVDIENKLVFDVFVNEAIGNCPKYINVRDLVPHPATSPEIAYEVDTMYDSDRLPDPVIDFIHSSDTVFLGTTYQAPASEEETYPSHLGMNQRGGRKGFVRVSEGRTIVLPDYSGNRIMTSLGNVQATPLASLTFVSFETGDILYLTGSAKNVFGTEAAKIMPRAGTLTTVDITGYTLVRDALPVRQRPGTVAQPSPYSPPIQLLASEKPGEQLSSNSSVSLISIDLHSPTVATFTWETPDAVNISAGQAAVMDLMPLLGPVPYQHMASHNPTSINDDRIRTWTVSKHSGSTFSLTMRHKPGGAATTALFAIANKLAQMRPELLADCHPLQLSVTLSGFTGGFTLREGRDMLWIAGGIGITPFIAMLRALSPQQAKRVRVVLAARDPQTLLPLLLTSASGAEVQVDVFTSAVLDDFETPSGVTIHPKTRLSSTFFESITDLTVRYVYLCGSESLEKTAMDCLESLGVDSGNIIREKFSY